MLVLKTTSPPVLTGSAQRLPVKDAPILQDQ